MSNHENTHPIPAGQTHADASGFTEEELAAVRVLVRYLSKVNEIDASQLADQPIVDMVVPAVRRALS